MYLGRCLITSVALAGAAFTPSAAYSYLIQSVEAQAEAAYTEFMPPLFFEAETHTYTGSRGSDSMLLTAAPDFCCGTEHTRIRQTFDYAVSQAQAGFNFVTAQKGRVRHKLDDHDVNYYADNAIELQFVLDQPAQYVLDVDTAYLDHHYASPPFWNFEDIILNFQRLDGTGASEVVQRRNPDDGRYIGTLPRGYYAMETRLRFERFPPGPVDIDAERRLRTQLTVSEVQVDEPASAGLLMGAMVLLFGMVARRPGLAFG